MSKNAISEKEVVVAIPTNGYTYRSLLSGFLEYARNAAGWCCSFVTGRSDEPPLEEILTPETACLVIDDELAERHAAIIRRTGPPVVTMAGARLPPNTVALIDADNATLGRLAAGHFLSSGFRSFAYVDTAAEPWWWSTAREKAFVRSLRAAGMACARFPGGNLGGWLAALPRPTAILAANDTQARIVLKECRRTRLRVPNDIAILGVDDDEILCETASPALSSIRWDTRETGFRVAEFIDRSLRRGRFPRKRPVFTYSGVAVCTRNSSRLVLERDAVAEKCLAYIDAHFTGDIDTYKIAAALGLYRRTVEKHFRATYKNSIREEIIARRTSYARKLIAEGNMSLDAIAARSGFFDASHLRKTLRKTGGPL